MRNVKEKKNIEQQKYYYKMLALFPSLTFYRARRQDMKHMPENKN